ncbi:hypothetical protein [Deinococcus depolymerans]|uniref:Carboxypeptidase regulatory-like domain-containing protein n=1 Tax=Deinococcus depolymerans TaxID=392408 RepID=A0ABN1CGB5_9DEIO
MNADLRGRVFTGPGPLHPTLTEARVGAIERVLRAAPHLWALLNVTLPGPDARPVHALLLGPGGADLIDLGGDLPGTLAAAARLRRLLPAPAPVTVTLLQADRAHPADPHPADPHPEQVPDGDPDALAGALHASLLPDGPLDPADVIARLDGRPARLAFLQGQVLSALEGQGVPGVQVWVQAGGQTLNTVTDADGSYALSADQGQELEIGFVPPLRYRAPDTLRLHPDAPHLSVEATRLPERASRLSEDDIRGVMMQAMQARLEAQLARDPQAWTDPARQLGAVIEDLRGQLRSASQQVTERQQEEPGSGATLAVQVRHAADRQLLTAQAQDLGRALADLDGAAGEPQQAAVQRAIDTLTRVTASRSSERRRTAPPPARPASLQPRLPMPLPENAPPLRTVPFTDTATRPEPVGAVPDGPAADAGSPAALRDAAETAPAPPDTASSGPDDVSLTPPAPVTRPDPRPAPVSPSVTPEPARPAATPRRSGPLPWVAGGLLGVAIIAGLILGGRDSRAPTAAPAQPDSPVTAAPTTPAPTPPTASAPVARPAPRVAVTVTETPLAAPAPPRVTVTSPAPTPPTPPAPATAPQPSTAARPSPARSAGEAPARRTPRVTPAATAPASRRAAPASTNRPPKTPEPVTPAPDLPFIAPPLPASTPPEAPATPSAVPTDTPGTDAAGPPDLTPTTPPPPALSPVSIPATPPSRP